MKTFGTSGWTLALVLALAGAGALSAGAQQQQPPPPTEQRQGPLQPKPPEGEPPPYSLQVEVPLVNVDVSVIDRDGNFIPGLRKEHFRIFQEGVEQEIVAFAPSEAPLTTVLVVEGTQAMGYILYQNIDTAYLFLRQLRKDDWVALVEYDMQPHVEVDFTHDPQEVVGALRRMQWGAGTFSEANMYDAVIDTLDRLKDVEGKKSIIVIGTGLNTFSKYRWDEALKTARQHRTVIYAVCMTWLLQLALERQEALGYRVGPQRMDLYLAEAQMRALAEATGGRAYFPRFVTQMPAIYQEIGGMLRNQYSLAFRPKNFRRDGKFHEISVKLVGPEGKPLQVVDQTGKPVKYEVHARKGYYVPAS